MLDRTAIDDLKSRVDLVELTGRVTELRKHGSEFAGPCPKCSGGGKDRFHVKPDGWFCRKCSSSDPSRPLWRDAIEFVQWYEGVSFADAVKQLADERGIALHKSPQQAQEAPVRAAKPKSPQDSRRWQIKAAQVANEAAARLNGAEGQPGREYLLSRGIAPATWAAYGLGFVPDVPLPGTWIKKERRHCADKQPAICMPWYRGGRIFGVRYRFLEEHTYTDPDGKERTAKQSALHGSKFGGGLYGGHVIDGIAVDLKTLIVTEGEINTISAWQVAGAGVGLRVDVLSIGSESQSITPAMVKAFAQYGRVICFVDREEIARSLVRATGAAAVAAPKRSPVDEKGQDANDLLLTGQLGSFIAACRYQAAESQEERRRLFYDLADAHDSDLLDDGAIATMEQIRAAIVT